MHRETITRRYLPHWYKPGAALFVTFRLANSLPQTALEELRQRKELLSRKNSAGPSEPPNLTHKRLFAMYDDYLDQGLGDPYLADPRIASLVRGSLHFLDREKISLLAYTIMPNHVHVLFALRDFSDEKVEANKVTVGEQPDSASPLASVMHSLKSYTAHEANRILQRSGPFWQRESYDHWVRDDDELERIVAYINANAVRAGFAVRPWEFFWCSTHERFLRDGDTSGWLGLETTLP